jgi:hypothetical protein
MCGATGVRTSRAYGYDLVLVDQCADLDACWARRAANGGTREMQPAKPGGDS